MAHKFYTALTERQREIVTIALALLDVDEAHESPITVSELEETLKLFKPDPNAPEPRVEHIPVLLNVDDQNPIGFGTIVGSKLFIQVDNEQVVAQVAHLARVGDIREIFLGLTFSINSVSTERITFHEQMRLDREDRLTRAKGLKDIGLANAEISEALGLSESVVRTILEEE